MNERRNRASWLVLAVTGGPLLLSVSSRCFVDAFSIASSVSSRSSAHIGDSSSVRFLFADECSLNTFDAEECIATAGYVRDPTEASSVHNVLVAEIETLRDKFTSFENVDAHVKTTNMIKYCRRREGKRLLASDTIAPSVNSRIANIEYNHLIEDRELVLVDTVRVPGMDKSSRAFHRAGPRKLLHFDPSLVNAAIVTCGGLCPGLNNVIRELVHSLHNLYGAQNVWGITGGYHGFHNPEYAPVLLTNEMVENIHHEGGTILRTSRGGFEIDEILSFLRSKSISQLYIIGGDGTHRGAYKIHEACMEAGLNIAVAGIPKTIDNDIDYIDRSFGFVSAVEAAQASIRSAKTEAMCTVPNAIGIIKLMGRSAGYLATFAALGSGDVDLVLVPEVPIVLDGPGGVLPFLRQRVKEQKFAVVVVAEGAGEELLEATNVVDRGGNRLLPPIGEYMRDRIKEYFVEHGEEATMKYIDPSYTVRSVPANGADSLYCMELAQNAVHGAMAGYTGFSVGLVNNNVVYLPIPQLVASSPRQMSPCGTTWERVLAMTGQPNTTPYVRSEEQPIPL
jgi:6-phosphofructokinase 1